MTSSPFALPEALAGKASPAIVGADEQHFLLVADHLERAVSVGEERLALIRLAPGGEGQAAMDRDLEVHRTVARLRTLRRFRLDLCLGRMVPAATPDAPVYIGRIGLRDDNGEHLLIDWRSPAAQPFFAATPAHPLGLLSRRRYRWNDGKVVDFWDEALGASDDPDSLALDNESALLASLGASRTGRMQDVLTTLQADQDEIIRASSRGPLVVDGGPGTGKTVVALHRAAYLLHEDPHLREGSGRLLVVGPHRPYLSYVADILPNLGESDVQVCTLRDLIPGDRDLPAEPDEEVARLKGSVAMVEAIEPAVGIYEEPPAYDFVVDTPWGDLRIGPSAWAEAFGAPDPTTPHNDARDDVRVALVDILVDQHRGEDDLREQLRRFLLRHPAIDEELGKTWPRIDPVDLVGDLWEVPAYLRKCAPWLSPAEVQALRRERPHRWTISDLPLLDAARLRLGDPEAGPRRRREEAVRDAEWEEMSHVVEHLIASDDSNMKIMSMLSGSDIRSALVNDSDGLSSDVDLLAGPFAHIVVDEAQELTDAEWQMLLARCPSRSFTLVGDRAQSRSGFFESWTERLDRVGLPGARQMSLRLNYRTPSEVMAVAGPVIRSEFPAANVPVSIRSTGVPVRRIGAHDVEALVEAYLRDNRTGTVGIVTLEDVDLGDNPRVSGLSPDRVKGLEFDVVVVMRPESFGAGIRGAVDRYVSMTRATQQLVLVE